MLQETKADNESLLFFQYYMTDPFPAIRGQYSEVSLGRLSQILTQPKGNPAAKVIDKIVEATFDYNIQTFDFEVEAKAFMAHPLTKDQFYDLVRKATARNLKKKEKSMESILAHMNSNMDMSEETKKVNRERHLRGFIKSIQIAGAQLHEKISQLQDLRDWRCPCESEICYDNKSMEMFQIDLFLFLLSSSPIIAEEIRQHVHIDTDLFVSVEDLLKHHTQMGDRKELRFELEKPCEELMEKKKKKNKSKNKNKKNKKKIQEQLEEADEDEKQLNTFLQKLEIVEQQRVGCRVSEQWMFKINAQNYFTRK